MICSHACETACAALRADGFQATGCVYTPVRPHAPLVGRSPGMSAPRPALHGSTSEVRIAGLTVAGLPKRVRTVKGRPGHRGHRHLGLGVEDQCRHHGAEEGGVQAGSAVSGEAVHCGLPVLLGQLHHLVLRRSNRESHLMPAIRKAECTPPRAARLGAELHQVLLQELVLRKVLCVRRVLSQGIEGGEPKQAAVLVRQLERGLHPSCPWGARVPHALITRGAGGAQVHHLFRGAWWADPASVSGGVQCLQALSIGLRVGSALGHQRR
mmetsp:Transcript_128325/g.357202  ORF Transcript_128325/g.357202 Transcript_128325/m.357202 type:complete len:268 (+) Transcript_128325:130-933(+)